MRTLGEVIEFIVGVATLAAMGLVTIAVLVWAFRMVAE